MKLRSKILIGYSVVLTLVILVCGWGVINLRRLGRASEAILEENYRSILAAENMIDAIERQDSAVLLFLLENQSQGQQQFLANEFEFLQWYSRAEDNITIAGEKELLKALEKQYQNYLNVAELNQQLTDSANYYEEILPVFQEVRQTCIKLRDLNQQTMVIASERAQEISEQATLSMIAAGGAAAGLGLTFSLLLSNRLVKPLKEMTLATTRIAEGDYDVEIISRSQDELGSLGRGITVMSQNLKSFHELNVDKVIAEKQRSEAIIYSISDGIVVVDGELKIIAINPTAANIINTKPQLATGNHFLTVFNNQQFYEKIEKTAQTGKSPPLAEEAEAILPLESNGKTEYYQYSITPVTTETEGKQLGVILLLQNVTKLKELDQLKSDFVATASHELRTPLTGMSMSINLLLETAGEKLSATEMELLEAAGEDVERLRGLVNELLDLSKMESGRMEIALASVEPQTIIKKAISCLKVQAQEKQVSLLEKNSSPLPQVKADADKIIWVLTNLIANAIRYTDAGGEIRVAGSLKGNWVNFSVSDDGAGIPLEYQSKIFDKFVQVETEKDVGGSGLGLAICQEIIKAHGGRIWVDSLPGEGSTFTFNLARNG